MDIKSQENQSLGGGTNEKPSIVNEGLGLQPNQAIEPKLPEPEPKRDESTPTKPYAIVGEMTFNTKDEYTAHYDKSFKSVKEQINVIKTDKDKLQSELNERESVIKQKLWTDKGYNAKTLELLKDKISIKIVDGSIVDNVEEVAQSLGLQKDLSKIPQSSIVKTIDAVSQKETELEWSFTNAGYIKK